MKFIYELAHFGQVSGHSVQGSSLRILGILAKVTVVVIEKNLDGRHVGEVGEPVNEDTIDLRDTLASIKLIAEDNSATWFDRNKEAHCVPSCPLVSRLSGVARIYLLNADVVPIIVDKIEEIFILQPRPSSLTTPAEEMVLGASNCFAILDGRVRQPHTKPCFALFVKHLDELGDVLLWLPCCSLIWKASPLNLELSHLLASLVTHFNLSDVFYAFNDKYLVILGFAA